MDHKWVVTQVFFKKRRLHPQGIPWFGNNSKMQITRQITQLRKPNTNVFSHKNETQVNLIYVKCKSTEVSQIKSGHQVLTTPKDIAKACNDRFINIGQTLALEIPSSFLFYVNPSIIGCFLLKGLMSKRSSSKWKVSMVGRRLVLTTFHASS